MKKTHGGTRAGAGAPKKQSSTCKKSFTMQMPSWLDALLHEMVRDGKSRSRSSAVVELITRGGSVVLRKHEEEEATCTPKK